MGKEYKYVYVVTMYKWGSRENHSYVLGVFDSKQLAEIAAKEERGYRANKYEYEIVVQEINIARVGAKAASTMAD